MYQDLRGKVVLVTGAGAGIGRAIASRFAAEQSVVVVNDVNRDAAEATVRSIADSGGEALALVADATDASGISAMVEQAAQKFDRVDILVNNVGLFEFGPLLGLTAAEWDRSLQLNVGSAYLLANAVAPGMIANGGGAIVNIASGAGKVGGTWARAYSVGKWALIGLTKSLAAELAPLVRVNAVCPGIIQTRMDEAYVRLATEQSGVSTAQYVQARLERIPMRREGTADDVASSVLFLASDQASYTTGEAMNVSGGMIMH